MPTKIKEIKNLTSGKVINTAAELAKFDKTTGFAKDIIGTAITPETWKDFASATDNIQVAWADGDKSVARGIGGKFTITDTDTKVTISGLTDASKFSLGLNGQVAIGPENNEAAAALLSVRVGNLRSTQNPSGDWIIDFSDKTDGATGSDINLKVLIDWISKKTGDKPDPNLMPEVKAEDGNAKKPEDFIIQFKNFYFNITQKTFDFWVVSKEGQSIQFGNFTIKKAGFRITNVAQLETPPAATAPAAIDNGGAN